MQIMAATGHTRDKRRLMRTFGQWTAAAAIAMLVLTGLGIEASADVVKQPDHGLSFEGICKEGGGIYTETFEGDGNAWCQHEDDTQTVCSLEGTDCYHISSQSQPTRPLIVDDTQTVTPVDAPLEAIAEAPLEAPVDSQVASTAESGTLAAPTEETYVQAEEPVVAEEPMAVEASAEQP